MLLGLTSPCRYPARCRNVTSAVRTIRSSKRRPTTRMPTTSAPGPGTATITSASVSATHAASLAGNRPKTDFVSLGWTRKAPPASVRMWTTAEVRDKGANRGVRRLEIARVRLRVVHHEQLAGRAAAALDRPRQRPADVCHPFRLRQGRGSHGQEVPLVRSLGIDPGVQTTEKTFAVDRQDQQDPGRRGQRLRQRTCDNRAHSLIPVAEQQPTDTHDRGDGRPPSTPGLTNSRL